MRQALILAMCVLVVGCGTTVTVQSSRPAPALKGVRNVQLELDVVAGAVSTEHVGGKVASRADAAAAAVADGTGSVMSGNDQAGLAAKDMQFEMGLLGFKFMPERDGADAVVFFSIGSVRYMKRWVADQAFLEFRDAKTGEPICTFRADAGSSPRPVKDMVKAIAKKLPRQM